MTNPPKDSTEAAVGVPTSMLARFNQQIRTSEPGTEPVASQASPPEAKEPVEEHMRYQNHRFGAPWEAFEEELQSTMEARPSLIWIETLGTDWGLQQRLADLSFESLSYIWQPSSKLQIWGEHSGDAPPEDLTFFDSIRWATSFKHALTLYVRFPSKEIDEKDAHQAIREFQGDAWGSAKQIIIISQDPAPSPIADLFVTLAEPLPSEEELESFIEKIFLEIEEDEHSEEYFKSLARAATGLNIQQTHFITKKILSSSERDELVVTEIISAYKNSLLSKSSGIEFYKRSERTMATVGGLKNLKQWVEQRNDSYSDEAKSYGVAEPRGVLLAGVPGTGKSLSAKTIAAEWHIPLLRLDVGAIFSKWYGESEGNLKSALAIAEAAAPCVLWIDEIEKALGGDGDNEEGGTTQRVIGNFLTWLQERKSPVFVVATANNIGKMRPEFLRKGRFDEIFFVDLPSPHERADIWQIHLQKLEGKKSAMTEITGDMLIELAEASDGFSGAEIEQVVNDAILKSFKARGPITVSMLLESLKATKPLSAIDPAKIRSIQDWGKQHAVPAGEFFESTEAKLKEENDE